MFGSVREACDPTLGVLQRRWGWWHGRIPLSADLCSPPPAPSPAPVAASAPAAATDPVTVPLRLPGGRRGPDPAALALAVRAPAELAACRNDIAAALDEHRRAAAVPPLTTPAVPIGLAVITFERRRTLELAYRVPWDDEHTLGARVRDGVLLELCGSI
ncbi:MAG: hypothetical protein AB7W59_20685 [Acidimicrobiia bacterium]